MGYFEIDPMLVETPALHALGAKGFRRLIEAACRFNRSRDIADFPEEFDELAWAFKFHHPSFHRRKWNRRRLWERFQGVCYLCLEDVSLAEFHIEHVVPLVRGGDDVEANLNIAHAECNNRKGSSLLSELDWYPCR